MTFKFRLSQNSSQSPKRGSKQLPSKARPKAQRHTSQGAVKVKVKVKGQDLH